MSSFQMLAEKMKKSKMNYEPFATQYYVDMLNISLGPLNECPAPCQPAECTKPWPSKYCTDRGCGTVETKQKGNNPMYVDNDKHIESSKINYLSARAENVQYGKEQGMRKTFGLVDDYAPETAADLVKRIQDGKFVLKDDTKDKTCYEPARLIKWRDPAVKEDTAGYKAAVGALGKVFQDTKDTIAIGTPAEGLAAVKALDAWTPTVGTA